MSYVVAVAGPTGGGKSALVQALVERLDDACALHMDDYERMTREPLERVARWAERGADFDELDVGGLVERLQALKAGAAPRYIVFETQFGRAHRATGSLIDLLIWIDVPLEIALARKLRGFCAQARQGPAEAARERLAWLDGYLAGYLDLVRRLLVLQAERVRPGADVRIDGSGTLEAMARVAREQVLARLH
jgi:uridine kinase